MLPSEILASPEALAELLTRADRAVISHAAAAAQFTTMKRLTGAREDDGAAMLKPVLVDLRAVRAYADRLIEGLESAIANPFQSI